MAFMPLSSGLSIGGTFRRKVKEEPGLTEPSAVSLLPDLLPAQKGHTVDVSSSKVGSRQDSPSLCLSMEINLFLNSPDPIMLEHNDHSIRHINWHFLENTVLEYISSLSV